MAKQKEVPKSQKPSRVKDTPVLSGKFKSSQLSKEHISDSDDEVSDPQPPAQASAIKKNGIAQVKPKGTPQKAVKKPPVKETVVLDESDTDDSNSDDGSDESGDSSGSDDSVVKLIPKIPIVAPIKSNGVKRKADKQSSIEEEESSDNGSSSSEPQAKKTKITEASSEESSEEESEDDNVVRSTPNKTAQEVPPPSAQASPPAPRTIHAQQYKPPTGYNPITKGIIDPAFAPNNLSGKQIWHITAPSSVPISSLTSFAATSIRDGTPILTHKETEYVLRPEADVDAVPRTLHLLLPTSSGPGDEGTYAFATQPVSQTLHLQLHFPLPSSTSKHANSETGGNAAAEVSAPAVSTIRPQPKGLKMRYRPPGFGKGDAGIIGSESEDEEEEEVQAETRFRLPKSSHENGKKKKTKENTPTATATVTETPAKKKKKSKHIEDVNGGTEEAPRREPPSPAGKGKKDDGELTEKEEKRRRKEEKRARKEAKLKAKAIVDHATK